MANQYLQQAPFRGRQMHLGAVTPYLRPPKIDFERGSVHNGPSVPAISAALRRATRSRASKFIHSERLW